MISWFRLILLGMLWLVHDSAFKLDAAVKVACVGDSITEGQGLGAMAYPARLGSLLGEAYTVRNYGAGGFTLLDKGDFPYRTTQQYKDSLSWEPDVVIILLGTNDSKPQNWQYAAEYLPDLRALVESYLTLESQPRVILGTPTPVYGDNLPPFNQSVVRDEIAPTTRSLAAELDLECLEFHDRLIHAGAYFPDGIHPDAAGTALMASMACEFIAHFSNDAPTASLFAISSTRMRIEWPAESAGYVLQESESLAQDSSDWEVVKFTAPKKIGSVIRAEPRKRGKGRFFRLWRP